VGGSRVGGMGAGVVGGGGGVGGVEGFKNQGHKII
jgi:hypothetical protein